MPPNENARHNHDALFPGHVSTLAVTDPELIETFDNFAFDEVLRHGSLDIRTRLMTQLAAIIACQALREYRVMAGAALDIGVTPVALNLTGSIQLIRAALPHLRAQGGGRIIQISSYGGQVAFAGNSLYHATKWGIEGFVESVAQEVAGFGIGMTIVEPGVPYRVPLRQRAGGRAHAVIRRNAGACLPQDARPCEWAGPR